MRPPWCFHQKVQLYQIKAKLHKKVEIRFTVKKTMYLPMLGSQWCISIPPAL